MTAARLLTAAVRLRTALEATADALARPNLDALLAAEDALAGALAELPSVPATDASLADDAERLRVREALAGAARALTRCRRLGGALGDFIRISLDARGQTVGYEPTRATAMTLTGRGLQMSA